MKDGNGRNLSASSVAAEIMVYGIQGLGMPEDEHQAWLSLFKLLGLERSTFMADALRREMFDLTLQFNPDADPDGFMQMAKEAIREHVRAQY